MSLTFKEGQKAFEDLLTTIDPKAINPLLTWIGDTYLDDAPEKPPYIMDSIVRLNEIAGHLRLKVPASATFDTESISFPTVGYDSDCNASNTVHVDCFLYDDEAVDDLVGQGKLSRTYCCECGSKHTKNLTFISHSLSIPQLEFMFTSLVPLADKKEGFRVVDIGSRLGGICAAAQMFSKNRAHVTGIEISEDFCKLQKETFESFDLPSISILQSDVRKQAEVIHSADLIIMNNVFTFFNDVDQQTDCWRFLYESMRPGCLLIHHPSVAEVTGHLDLPFTLQSWLKTIKTKSKCAKFAGSDEELFEDCAALQVYEVLDRPLGKGDVS